jgi:hypothetical protein
MNNKRKMKKKKKKEAFLAGTATLRPLLCPPFVFSKKNKVSVEKSAVILMDFPLYVILSFSFS